MSIIKAKFKCMSVADFGSYKQVQMSAIYGQEGESADFAKATPYGELKINIDSGVAASNFFNPCKEYYLTFENCEQ
jgi:hypothetical protein